MICLYVTMIYTVDYNVFMNNTLIKFPTFSHIIALIRFVMNLQYNSDFFCTVKMSGTFE